MTKIALPNFTLRLFIQCPTLPWMAGLNAIEYIAAQMGDINRKMTDFLEMQHKSTEALRGLDERMTLLLTRIKF